MGTVQLINLVYLSCLTALITSMFMLVAYKYDMYHKYYENKKNWMPRICYLCITFWACAFVCVVLDYWTDSNTNVFVCAFAATPIARVLSKEITL